MYHSVHFGRQDTTLCGLGSVHYSTTSLNTHPTRLHHQSASNSLDLIWVHVCELVMYMVRMEMSTFQPAAGHVETEYIHPYKLDQVTFSS